ncbi:MAG: hypothetical protein IPK82_07425 [Polyangiaceae bacterium]|nr:hypothetical protein [Polyangiaceae bacterium]
MVTQKCTHAAAAFAAVFLWQLSASADPVGETTGEATAEKKEAAAEEKTEKPAPKSEVIPSIHHTPLTSAKASEPLRIDVTIEFPHLVKNAHVVYRTGDKWQSVRLLRTESGYSAVIPAEHVQPPRLGYTIEVERIDGSREAIFATRELLQPVIVHDDDTDAREAWLLDRLAGRRSVVSATGELVRFGKTVGKSALPCAPNQEDCPLGQSRVPEVDDQYWRVEASYTYRPLRTVSEFGFKAGVVRGRSVVDVNQYDDDKFDVGLNYAGANVRFRLADIFHTEFELMGSVTEVGFSTGAGAAVILGDPYAFRLTFGWQTIGFTEGTYFGTRFYTRMDLPVNSRITLAPSVEVTDMPHADRFGVRLLADGGFVLGKGFTLWVRGGYQARVSQSGGPAVGGTLQFGF